MTPFARHIRDLVASEGPISVERYMSLCARHYYATRDPLGAGGDFITSPEISQMFGELVGLWAAAVWQAMGRPDRLSLVELGPGRGTLMADALRAMKVLPDLSAALSVHLVETSPALRGKQEQTLAAAGLPLTWHADVAEVAPGPAIVIANEFFDALPVRQFVATERGWCERLVGVEDERLVFGLSAEPEPSLPEPRRVGDVLEVPEAALGLTRALAGRLAREGGAALIVDYGYWDPLFADTLQAVQGHAFADPLEAPGEADLTAHVPFKALAEAALQAGASVHGPAPQGDFLAALGIEARAERLKSAATPEQAAAVDAALNRLTERGPTGMGELFKVLGLSHPSIAPLPGLAPLART